MLKTKFLRWIPAIIIMVAIFAFSAQPADVSTKQSNSVAEEITWISRSDKPLDYEETNFLRKSAHFLSYLSLGVSVFWALSAYDIKKQRMVLYSAVICLTYAVTDELHQAFVPGRSPEFWDVCIDFGGAVCRNLIMLFIYWIKPVKKP